jgi:hypothetical protein
MFVDVVQISYKYRIDHRYQHEYLITREIISAKALSKTITDAKCIMLILAYIL